MKSRSLLQLIFALLLTLALLAALVGMVVLIKSTTTAVSMRESEIEQQNILDQSARSLQESLKEAEVDINSLANRIVTEETVPALLGAIEAKGRALGAKVSIESAAEEAHDVVPDVYEYLRVSVRAEGTWREVYSFVQAMEQLPYKHRMHSVALVQTTSTVASSTTRGWSTGISFSILKLK